MEKDLNKAKELLPDLDYDELIDLLDSVEIEIKKRIYEDYREETK